MQLTRQDFLKTMGVIASGSALSSRPLLSTITSQTDVPSLRQAAAVRGLLYGSDSDVAFSRAPQPYKDLFVRQCALYAANLGWGYISPYAGQYDLAPEQPSIDFVTSSGIQLTGAHLLWHEQIPAWFASLRSPTEARQAIEKHVSNLCGRFSGKVFAWNVVNEAINPRDGRIDGLRSSPFGLEDFVIAFKAARLADPNALLVYNDFAMELDTHQHEIRRATLLNLIDWLRRRGAPLDAVGLQSHLRTADFKFNASKYRKFLGEIAARDLRIIISELDVFDTVVSSDIVARDQAVSDVYSQFLNAALDEAAVCAVVTWGLSDRYTWLAGRHIRSDGLPTRPLPFDADLRPKPAFFAILNALSAAPAQRGPPVPLRGKLPK